MRLYSGRVKHIASDLAKEMVAKNAIELESDAKQAEVMLDIESVLREYIRTEREINEHARSIMEKRGLDYSAFGKLKRETAKKRSFGLGEDALAWIMNQLNELILHTAHIEEVWFDEREMRLLMRPILRKHMESDSDLDEEVRKRIKNLNEGSNAWDIKYQQVMEEMKRRRGLEE